MNLPFRDSGRQLVDQSYDGTSAIWVSYDEIWDAGTNRWIVFGLERNRPGCYFGLSTTQGKRGRLGSSPASRCYEL